MSRPARIIAISKRKSSEDLSQNISNSTPAQASARPRLRYEYRCSFQRRVSCEHCRTLFTARYDRNLNVFSFQLEIQMVLEIAATAFDRAVRAGALSTGKV